VISEDVRTTILLVPLAGLVTALVLLLAPRDEEIATREPLVTAEQSSPRAEANLSERGATSTEPSRTRRPKKTPAERERMRRQIIDALQARATGGRDRADQVDAENDTSDDTNDDGRRARDEGRPESDDDEDTAPPPADLKDRTGNHGYLLKVMNEELMPLADECYTLARHDNPELAGLLVLDIDIIGDEEIGGLIEAVRPGEANELVDPILLECMRESLFATTLPQPEESGRDAISLSMPLSPGDAPGDS